MKSHRLSLPLLVVSLLVLNPIRSFSAPSPASGALQFLRDAFEHKDVDAYGSLLAGDFTFRYRQDNVDPGDADTMNRAEELRFAQHLFVGGAASGAPPAEGVQLELKVLDHVSIVGERGVRWERLLVETHLSLSFARGRTTEVEGPVALLFRWEGGLEEPWKLVDWTELEGAPGKLASCLYGRGPSPGGSVDSLPGRVAEIRRLVYALGPAVPNPFRGAARMEYEIPSRQPVRIQLYSVDGRRARILFDGIREPGRSSVNIRSDGLAPGLYFVRMDADGRSFKEKILLIR